MTRFKQPYLLICFFLIYFIIESANCTVLVKAGNNIKYNCQKNIYNIKIDVIFSEKPKEEVYFFTLTLASPENLNFKCMLDYSKSQIYCSRAFSDEADSITKTTYLQFPYPFPELDDIEWDYETFLQKIYRKVWSAGQDCGNEDIFNVLTGKPKIWDIEGVVTRIENGICQPASVNNDTISKYNFYMHIRFNEGGFIDDSKTEFLQEIWVPLLPRQENKQKTKTYQRDFSFAYCKTNNIINRNSSSKIILNCEIPIKEKSIFNGIIKIGSFYDELYINHNNEKSIISLYIKIRNSQNLNYLTLLDNDQGIICPNQPLFTIDSKNDISMGEYYSENNKYTFYIIGTLTNGYYVFKNGTTVELNETYKDIKFNLKIEDNLIESDEEDQWASCILPYGAPFQQKKKAKIECIGRKDKKSEQNNNVDITLNWKLKVNNNFNNIIISWPKTIDESYKKNIYLYHLTGLSIRQSNFACHSNNFDFYVYIYNLYHEPKISFNLPLTSPRSGFAKCDLFDTTALKCSLNLKHKKLSKGDRVMLPELGSKNQIFTLEGNRVYFTMNNFSKINNDHDFYVNLEEECGDYLVVGTLKDMGMSHKNSVVTYVLIIVTISLIVVGFIIYIAWKIRTKRKRGAKLSSAEEKPGDNTIGGKQTK